VNSSLNPVQLGPFGAGATLERRRDSRGCPQRSLRRLLHKRQSAGGWQLLAFGSVAGDLIAATCPTPAATVFLVDAARALAAHAQAVPSKTAWNTAAGFRLHAATLEIAGERLLLLGVEKAVLATGSWGAALYPRPSLCEPLWRAAVIRIEARVALLAG
jgi:hypothetical protein